MYPDVSYVYPACILNSFEIRVKYMQNVKIHVFSWNVTEHVRYVWDTSRYIRIRVSCRIHAGYIRIRILITNPTKFDNKPHLSRGPRVFRCSPLPQHKAISLDPPSECRTNVGGRVWAQDTQLTQDRVTDHSGPKAVDSRPRSRPFPVRSTWQRNTVGRVLHHVSTASTVFSI